MPPNPPGPLPQRTPTSQRPQAPQGASGEKAPASSAPPAQGGGESTRISFKVPSFENHVTRSRTYAFVLHEGAPVELGSGRFAKAYLGEERWLESKTAFSRQVAIKLLQKGVSEEDALRFQMEKELLERVQGHPNIIELHASGEAESPEFIPPSLRDKVENDFMILELLDMSLEERLKGSRTNRAARDDLLAYGLRERLFRVLEYMIPVAAAVEYAHLVRDICHRDIKPANVLVRLPDPRLRGATLDVRLADFNVGKVKDANQDLSMTRFQQVPGTLFFQAPEQETNVLELLVNVESGSPEVEFFEDFYMHIAQNDTFSLFNRNEHYPVVGADRGAQEAHCCPSPAPRRASATCGRSRQERGPAGRHLLAGRDVLLPDLRRLREPEVALRRFHKFIEYERAGREQHSRGVPRARVPGDPNLRAPKKEADKPEVAPADRFFTYKHYLDGNGELIDQQVMLIIARAMIRNKPDSYCQAWDVDTPGISDLVADLVTLYGVFGVDASARPAYLGRFSHATQRRRGSKLPKPLAKLVDWFRTRPPPGQGRQPPPTSEGPPSPPPPAQPPQRTPTGRNQLPPPTVPRGK